MHHRRRTAQGGVTLIELMIGLVIGLLVVAVAMAVLMANRSITGTVSDVSHLQQQGAHILRTIGLQLRQAGGLYLNVNPRGEENADILSPAVFETTAISESGGNAFDQNTDTLWGDGKSFTVGFMRYGDEVFRLSEGAGSGGSTSDFLSRNCIGLPANTSPDKRIESIFSFDSGTIRCGGNGASAQPIASNVAEFKVTYLEQNVAPGLGTFIQSHAGDDFNAPRGDPRWRKVQGVQVCFVLYGSEPIEPGEKNEYFDCSEEKVDVTKLSGNRKNRMHVLFRNTFQIRSQGLLGNAP